MTERGGSIESRCDSIGVFQGGEGHGEAAGERGVPEAVARKPGGIFWPENENPSAWACYSLKFIQPARAAARLPHAKRRTCDDCIDAVIGQRHPAKDATHHLDVTEIGGGDFALQQLEE